MGECDAVEAGTGYFITGMKHYRSMREKIRESIKNGQFMYSFALMDLQYRDVHQVCCIHEIRKGLIHEIYGDKH